MRCKKTRSLLTELIDESLTENIRQSLNAHLEICTECQDELRGLTGIHKTIKAAYKFNAPPGFAARVMGRLPADTATGSPWTETWFSLNFRGSGAKFLQWAGATAAVLAIVSGIVFGGMLSDKLLDLREAIVPETGQDTPALSYLDYLDPAPPESLAMAYFAMENDENER